ncbi:MAG: hypothetical protein LBV08_01935 [Clostridiales bacterium]|jgi:hypothetical protein|nr:hypothetical protein [Clostridiales bacterium]
MNFAKNGFRIDNNILMLGLLVLIFCPNILGMFGLGDNMLIYLILFLILTGGFGV